MTGWMLLKVVHVLAGVIWVGGALISALYIAATARALGPAAGPVVKHIIEKRKLPVMMAAVAGITVLSGLVFYDQLSNHFRQPLVTSFYGWSLTLGAAFGLLGFILGIAIPTRAARRLGALTAQLTGPPTPEQAAEIARLQQRLHVGGLVVAVLLLLAVVGMAMSHPIVPV